MTSESGAFIALVGPDGVGKTSVAAELISRAGGRYFHFRPPLRRRWGPPTPGEFTIAVPPSHTGRLFSVLRMAKAFLLFWFGYLRSVRPEVKVGRLVVADRWAYGYLVHPAKLGIFDAPILARMMLRALPQPDMVFALVADPLTIHSRKQELSLQEATKEADAWASLPISQLARVEADGSIASIVDTIQDQLDQIR